MRWGARRASLARSTGCGRCIRSSRPSGRRPRSRTSCRSQSTASRPATRRAATASWRRRRSRCAASTTTSPSSNKAKVVLDPARRADIILADAKNLAFAQGFELVEDDGLLAEVAGPGRVAGGADGLVRAGVPVDPRRGDPRHHPQQPEMLRAARSADRASSSTSSFWSPTSKRRTAARRSSPATSA